MARIPDARILTWVEPDHRGKWWVHCGFWASGESVEMAGGSVNCPDAIRIGPFPNRNDATCEMRGRIRADLLDQISELRHLADSEVVALALEDE